MAFLIRRHNLYSARVRIPADRRTEHGGKEFLQRSLGVSDKRTAMAEATAWEGMLRLEWAKATGQPEASTQSRRALYDHVREAASAGTFLLDIRDEDAVEAGIGYEIEKIADAHEQRELTEAELTRLAALQDAAAVSRGQPVKPRRELEPLLKELTDDFMTLWRTQAGLKETNTDQQKLATFKLFAGFFGERRIREVTKRDAALFVDALRQMDPLWARSPKAKALSWAQLQKQFGGRPRGLADGTINRHMATLQALWTWAQEREFCEGNNPFSGFHRKLKEGKNVKGYVAWETDELNKLFAAPPKRSDLREAIVVGMFTGMRLNEIASLRWDQVRTDDGVNYLQVDDAKTPAGNREVPLHPSLSWLAERKENAKGSRVWPTFNAEGPGKKAGADASREFSYFKSAHGFTDKRKAFHSFRKNVTRIMERARVHENEWAQVFGHEKGFTYGRYNADGLTLPQKAAIIGLIDYPEVNLPEIVA